MRGRGLFVGAFVDPFEEDRREVAFARIGQHREDRGTLGRLLGDLFRAGDNPRLHSRRWSGLVMWWQDTFGKLSEAFPKNVDLINASDGISTPLPPDRRQQGGWLRHRPRAMWSSRTAALREERLLPRP